MALPPPLQKLRQTLESLDCKECFLVGGAVRDLLLGREFKEADVAVLADAKETAKKFADHLSLPFVPLDEEEGVYRVPHAFGLEYVDFTQAHGSIESDLLRRDFTVNALALPLTSESHRQIVDPSGGLDDLKRRKIRMVSKEGLRDDPIRLLRGWRLSAQLEFDIEPETRKALSELAPLLRGEAGERVREELFKVLELPRSATHLQTALDLGLLFAVLPELAPLKSVPADGYHHLDGLAHSLETVNQLEGIVASDEHLGPSAEKVRQELSQLCGHAHSRLARLKFCALVHDIGKPSCMEEDEEGGYHFYGHERVGAEMAKAIAERLKFTAKDAEAVEAIVKAHMRPGQLAMEKTVTERAKLRLFRQLGELSVEVLVLSLADRYAARGPELEPQLEERQRQLVQELLSRFFDWREMQRRKRLLTGHDIMRRYGLPPGPLVGQILKEIEEAQFSLGLSTKEEALKIADQVARKLGVKRDE